MEVMSNKKIYLVLLLIFFISLNPLYAENSNDSNNLDNNSLGSVYSENNLDDNLNNTKIDDVNEDISNNASNNVSNSKSNSASNNANDNLKILNNGLNPSSASLSYSNRPVMDIVINDNNYRDYFDIYTGEILDSADIIPGDTIRIGNVTNKSFVVDRKLILTTISSGDQISNGVVHLVKGSDGTKVIGLRIINELTNYVVDGIYSITLHGIWLSSTNNNFIFNNTVRVAEAFKVFAMPMGWSSNNTIIYNSLISTGSTCMPMGDSHNNNISYNYMQTTMANVIYYNPFGHADYGGSPVCNNNYISNNYIYTIYASDTAIGMQLSHAKHYNTSIINNTFVHNYDGLSHYGENAVVTGNTFINMTSYGILITSSNLLLTDNTVIATDSNGGGIYVNSQNDSNITVSNNVINISNGCYRGINIVGNNILVANNTINILNFGVGISVSGEDALVLDNIINTNIDEGINIHVSNAIIANNKIKTGAYGIHIKTSGNQKIYFNTIANNTIVSKLYGIFLQGNIYNTTIYGNKISTNASVGIFKDTTDSFGDNDFDNIVNDIITDSTGILINDDNFYTYFDSNGYFKLNAADKNIVLFLTHLSNKRINIDQRMILLSNGLANLLINVTMTVESYGSGSTIKDLNFYNKDLNAIILEDYVDNVDLIGNDITIISDNKYNGSLYGISVGLCENINILRNNIRITADNAYIYGITIADNSFSFSKYFIIDQNSIILIGNRLVEGIYTDSLRYSNITNNIINLWGDGFGYGIATANVKGPVSQLNIFNNVIIANIKEMAYLIELHMSENIFIINNSLHGSANGVYGISVYYSNNITIDSNNINTFGGDLDKIGYNPDVLGSGNSAVFITADSNNTLINSNIIYTNAKNQIFINSSSNDFNNSLKYNFFVINDDNIMNYFDSNGELYNEIVQEFDTLLFDTLKSKFYSLFFNIPLNISSYSAHSVVNASFTFLTGASNSNITNLFFNLSENSAIFLIDVFNITFTNNNVFISNFKDNLYTLSAIVIAHNSFSNKILNNTITMLGNYSLTGISVSNFYQNRYGRSPSDNLIAYNSINISSNNNVTGIYLSMTPYNDIYNNVMELFSNNSVNGILMISSNDFKPYPVVLWNNNTKIRNNIIFAQGTIVFLIKSYLSVNTLIIYNELYSKSNISFAYLAYNVNGDYIAYNNIIINGSGIIGLNTHGSGISGSSITGSGISGSSDNDLNIDDWIKTSHTGIYYSNGSFNNQVINNTIVSNYRDGGDFAVFVENGSSAIVEKNYLISDNGKLFANDAVFAPSSTVDYNTPYYIYVSVNGSDSHGNGSKDNPYKTIAYGISQANNMAIIYISSGVYNENNLLINKHIILKNLDGPVVINGRKGLIFNITDTGELTVIGLSFINASGINGSVFINNGQLSIMVCEFSNNSVSGEGSVVFNNGTLFIDNSTFSFNRGYLGGVISSYGNVTIKSSKFFNNTAVSGGVIYTYHNSVLDISNSAFLMNSVKIDGSTYLYNDNITRLSPGSGGAIYSFGLTYIYNSTFESNSAQYGGAISNSAYLWRDTNDSELYIIDSIFRYNTARTNGGAINGNAFILLIHRSDFFNNEANYGGAIYFKSNNSLITSSNFTKNTAGSEGGALFLMGTVTMYDVFIANNTASYGGAIHYKGEHSYDHTLGLLSIYNSTIQDNRALNRGGALSFDTANVNISNSNIVDNFSPYGVMYTMNSYYGGYIDLEGNWWGNNLGPDDSVWNGATYFRNWLLEKISLGTANEGNSNNNNPNDNNNNQGFGNGGNSGFGGNGNYNSGSGSGTGFGTGTGYGLGSGTGTGLGDGTGSGMGSGDGSGIGSGETSNVGRYQGSNSNSEDSTIEYEGIGEFSKSADSSSPNSGGKSGGSSAGSSGESNSKDAFEVIKDKITNITENDVIYVLIATLLFGILISLGYLYNRRKNVKL
jgi:parallel beta-helix repeat protein